MPVLAVYKYAVKPGRMHDFMAKFHAATDPKFNSPRMPVAVRLFRSSVPGPDTGGVVLMLEYPNMTAWGQRVDFESANEEWKRLFDAHPDAPETLVSVELLTQL